MSFTQHFIGLFIESAPWLLMGFSVAGLMKAFVPSQVLAKHLGEPGLLATIKAALGCTPALVLLWCHSCSTRLKTQRRL